MQQQGTVRWYSAKGYGFIDPMGGVENQAAVYFHISDVQGRRVLRSGDVVLFDVVQVPKGLKCANVRLAAVVDTKEDKSCPPAAI